MSNGTERNDDDYNRFSRSIEDTVNSWKDDKDRYQDIDQRMGREPVFHKEAELLLARGKYSFLWRDIMLMKDCKEMMIYQSIMNDLKPRTIIEMGSYHGGSAVWFADIMKAMDLECHVYTVEILDHLIKPVARTHPGVTCITGDANKIEEVMPSKMLSELPHPWLVIEDCHHNVFGSLEHFGKHMVSGDYFATEDTSYFSPYMYDMLKEAGQIKEGSWSDGADEKHKIVIKFLQKYKGVFKVDSYYTDLFGFNGTNTWDGYIRKL